MWQVVLRDGTSERVCLVSRKVKPGWWVKLKNSEDPQRWWEVIWVSDPLENIHTDWHVGGL